MQLRDLVNERNTYLLKTLIGNEEQSERIENKLAKENCLLRFKIGSMRASP